MTDREESLACGWMVKPFILAPDLAGRLARVAVQVEQETGRRLEVISGHRSRRVQESLERSGRPAAPPELSNHTLCPSRAADVRLGALPTNAIKAIFGRIAVLNGLRWGGGSPIDSETGIPSDWNHVDLGPRMDREAQDYRAQQ